MPGQIKQMIDSIVQQRSKGNATLVATTKTKLTLKGVNPERFTSASPDDAAVLEKLRVIAAELGVRV